VPFKALNMSPSSELSASVSFSSQMICCHPRSKVCVQQLLGTFVVQKLSLTH